MQRDFQTSELALSRLRAFFSNTGHRTQIPQMLHWLPICCVIGMQCASAAEDFNEQTINLLVEAVEVAVANDFYNARCRGDVSGRRTDKLNKLLVSKLRITVLSVQDDLFPERSYRRVQKRLEADNIAALENIGGCQGAKDAAFPETLRVRYEAKLDAIKALP